MSRRYEFLEEGAEVRTGREVKDEQLFDADDGIADDDRVLILGNAYAGASVLVGSKEYLQELLQGWIDQVNAS